MKQEEKSLIELVNSKQLGDVHFFRYFLSTGNVTKERIPTVIFNVHQLLKKLNNQQGLASIYATGDEKEEIILITGQTENRVMVNVFLDFSSENEGAIKQIEVVGEKGMYQFDSTSETAFQSNFLTPPNEFNVELPSAQALAFFEKVKASYQANQVVYFGGDQE